MGSLVIPLDEATLNKLRGTYTPIHALLQACQESGPDSSHLSNKALAVPLRALP